MADTAVPSPRKATPPVTAPADPQAMGGTDPTYAQILQTLSRMEGTLNAVLPAHAAELADLRRSHQDLDSKFTQAATDLAVVKSELTRQAQRPGLWWQAVGAVAGALGTIVAIIAMIVAFRHGG